MAKILILEDEYLTANDWRDALRTAGHEVTLSYTSSEAVAHVGHEVFDVFVVGMRITIKVKGVKDSGIRFLGHLATMLPREELSKRVIGVSGLLIENSDTLVRQSFQLFDVTRFMPKPFEPVELVTQVEAVLDGL